jgi:hypothetical protein
MASVANRLLANRPPATLTIGKVIYHPEAIMFAARPAEALLPVLAAVREATRAVMGSPGQPGNKLPGTPHITISYSTSQHPAEPIMAALGRSLPEREVQIAEVSLVNQRGPERGWGLEPRSQHPVRNVTLIVLRCVPDGPVTAEVTIAILTARPRRGTHMSTAGPWVRPAPQSQTTLLALDWLRAVHGPRPHKEAMMSQPQAESSWRKSSASCCADCVEWRIATHGVDVRHSKDPDGPCLHFSPSEWQAFLQGVKQGEADL